GSRHCLAHLQKAHNALPRARARASKGQTGDLKGRYNTEPRPRGQDWPWSQPFGGLQDGSGGWQAVVRAARAEAHIQDRTNGQTTREEFKPIRSAPGMDCGRYEVTGAWPTISLHGDGGCTRSAPPSDPALG